MTEPRIIKTQDFWLTGWKSLAKYVDYSIKSCKRMVRDGLPRHSCPTSGRPMFKSAEVDLWMEKKGNRTRSEMAAVQLAEYRSRHAKKMKLYFIISEDERFLKIGIATSPTERLKGLQTNNPLKLRLLGFIDGDGKLEQEMHLKFKKYAQCGEWFLMNEIVKGQVLEILKSQGINLAS